MINTRIREFLVGLPPFDILGIPLAVMYAFYLANVDRAFEVIYLGSFNFLFKWNIFGFAFCLLIWGICKHFQTRQQKATMKHTGNAVIILRAALPIVGPGFMSMALTEQYGIYSWNYTALTLGIFFFFITTALQIASIKPKN